MRRSFGNVARSPKRFATMKPEAPQDFAYPRQRRIVGSSPLSSAVEGLRATKRTRSCFDDHCLQSAYRWRRSAENTAPFSSLASCNLISPRPKYKAGFIKVDIDESTVMLEQKAKHLICGKNASLPLMCRSITYFQVAYVALNLVQQCGVEMPCAFEEVVRSCEYHGPHGRRVGRRFHLGQRPERHGRCG